jgi:hypothetical protein
MKALTMRMDSGWRMIRMSDAGHEVGHGADGFHEDAAFFRVTQGRCFVSALFGFLALPDFIAQVVDDGHLEFVVPLGHGSHSAGVP